MSPKGLRLRETYISGRFGTKCLAGKVPSSALHLVDHSVRRKGTMTQAHHKALVQISFSEPPQVKEVPTPEALPGQALVRILAARIAENTRGFIEGKAGFPLDFPLVPGAAAVGRIHAVGPDAIKLTPGKLVLIDYWIRGRDDPSHQILMGGHNGGPGNPANKLMQGEWRDSTMAEYAKVPLENAFPLDEDRLIREMGYEIPELLASPPFLPNMHQ